MVTLSERQKHVQNVNISRRKIKKNVEKLIFLMDFVSVYIAERYKKTAKWKSPGGYLNYFILLYYQ